MSVVTVPPNPSDPPRQVSNLRIQKQKLWDGFPVVCSLGTLGVLGLVSWVSQFRYLD